MTLCGGFDCVYGSCGNYTVVSSSNHSVVRDICVCEEGFDHDYSLNMHLDCSNSKALRETVFISLSVLNLLPAVIRTVIFVVFLKDLFRAKQVSQVQPVNHSGKSIKLSESVRIKMNRKAWFYFRGWLLSLSMLIYCYFLKLKDSDPSQVSYFSHAFFVFIPCCLMWSFAGLVIVLNDKFASQQIQNRGHSLSWLNAKHASKTLPALWFAGNLLTLPIGATLPSGDDKEVLASKYNQLTLISAFAQLMTTLLMAKYVIDTFRKATAALNQFKKSFHTANSVQSKAGALLKRCIVMQRFILTFIIVYISCAIYNLISYLVHGYTAFNWIVLYTIYLLISLEFYISYYHSSGGKQAKSRHSRLRFHSTTSSDSNNDQRTSKQSSNSAGNDVHSRLPAVHSNVSSAKSTMISESAYGY